MTRTDTPAVFREKPEAATAPDLTVIIVSYNTAQLTLAAIRTLYEQTDVTQFRCVVFDNASTDGSAAAIAAAFPQVDLIASPENLGFARANNVVAAAAETEWLLLLNPDTEVHDQAVDRLMAFAQAHPQGGIYGGRTVFRDGTLNIASCWGRMTPWSVFCKTSGLSAAFPQSEFFNPEAYGGWRRDTVREVDVVVGCFMLIRRALWNELGGFDLKYFMYGEEADLCLRARKLGFRPLITPDAEIMHIVGPAANKFGQKEAMVSKARVTLIRDHWHPWLVPLGLGMMRAGLLGRYLITRAMQLSPRQRDRDLAARFSRLWASRHEWYRGYTG